MLKFSTTRWYFLALLLAAAQETQAQTGGVRMGTPGAPDPSAVLDLRPDAATTPKGFLPPRLTQMQRDAIRNPAAGLLVFNTSTNNLNVWDGSRWLEYLLNAEPVSFGYTGAPQTYTVPPGVTRLAVDMAGASGGQSASNSSGLGGRVQATLSVTPGEVLTIYVGGAGGLAAAGYNGGGMAVTDAGGGGGATDLRQGGTAPTNRVLVAGGGGGASKRSGGCGGGLSGCASVFQLTRGTSTAGGGNPTAPGAGGAPNGSAGTAATGGAGGSSTGTVNAAGGGGGGGYFGGGGGGGSIASGPTTTTVSGGGGGGSSYAGAGASAVEHTQGYQSGNGYVRLRNADAPAPVLDGRNFVNVPGDNLGNHTATQNLNLGTYLLVGNGGSQGLSVSSTGNVDIAGSVGVASSVDIAGSVGIDGNMGVAGRVGVGTTGPVAQLEVDLPTASASPSLKLEHRGSNLIVRPATAGGGSSVVENTAGHLLLNPSANNVGIGTTAPRA
jgi:hypothetical protein